MSNVIELDFVSRVIPEGLIDLDIPYNQKEYVPPKVAPDAIKSLHDIRRIQKYFKTKGKYRDNLIFTMGINFGLRAGDLLKFKFGTLLEVVEDPSDPSIRTLACRNDFYTEEEKTNKKRHIYVSSNKEVVDALYLYLQSIPKDKRFTLNDCLFFSQSRNKMQRSSTSTRNVGCGIKVDSFSDSLKKAVKDLGLNYHVASHTMRKTFAYHYLTNYEGDKNRALYELQKILNHSSPSITLDYIGITDKDIQNNILGLYRQDNQYTEILRQLG